MNGTELEPAPELKIALPEFERLNDLHQKNLCTFTPIQTDDNNSSFVPGENFQEGYNHK